MIEHERILDQGQPCVPGSVRSIPLTETSPGTYETWWTVPSDLPSGLYHVAGCLTVAGLQKAVQPPSILILLPAPPPPEAAAPPSIVSQPPAATPPEGTPLPPPVPPEVPTTSPVPIQPLPGPIIEHPIGLAAGGPIKQGMRVTPDDLVILGVRSAGTNPTYPNVTAITVQMTARLWGDDGQFSATSLTATPPTDRSQNFYAIQLGYGYLESVAVVATTSGVHAGEVFCTVRLARGKASAFTAYAALAAGYPSTHGEIGWPGGPIRESIVPPGRIYYWGAGLGGTGQDLAITVPTNTRWRLLMLQAQLSNSGTAANRRPGYSITDPTHSMAGQWPTGITMTAGQVLTFSWAAQYAGPTAAVGSLVGLPLPDIWMPGGQNGAQFGTATPGLQVNDVWSPPTYVLEEVILD